MEKLVKLNSRVQNWDFSRDIVDFLKLLTERNMHIFGETEEVDFQPENGESQNVAVVDYSLITNLEAIAYHVGFPHQRRIYARTYKRTEHPVNKSAFFSLDPKDVDGHLKKDDIDMVYFLDMSNVEDARVQTIYIPPVMDRYDVDDMLTANKGMSIDKLAELHKILNEKWIRQNTIPFDINQLQQLREQEDEWIILPGPVDVQY